MKNIRSQSLNWAFVALVFSVAMACLLNFDIKNLNTTHLIPIKWNDNTKQFVFWEMPAFSIWYIIPLLTLFVFGICYYYLSFLKDKKDFISSMIAATTTTTTGIAVGILFSVLDISIFYLLTISAITMLHLPNIGSVCLITMLWVTKVVICILFHTRYGLIEHFGIIIMLVIFFLCINIVIISIVPFVRALIERVVLLAKSKEIKGIEVEKIA